MSHRNRSARRWPEPISHRFIPCPSAMLEHAPALGLTPTEAMTVVALLADVHDEHQAVVTVKADTLASRLNLRRQTITGLFNADRRLGQLVKRTHVRGRAGRMGPCSYDLTGLWARLAELSQARPDRADEPDTVESHHAGEPDMDRAGEADTNPAPPCRSTGQQLQRELREETPQTARERAEVLREDFVKGTVCNLTIHRRKDDDIKLITHALSEHAELSLEDHRAVLAAALADPWWSDGGARSVAVVFGQDRYALHVATWQRHRHDTERHEASRQARRAERDARHAEWAERACSDQEKADIISDWRRRRDAA